MQGSPSFRQLAFPLLLVAFAFVAPLFLSSYLIYVGSHLLVYAVLALGLNVLVGWAGQFAFAHIAFFGIGAYATALMQIKLGLPLFVALPFAAALAGLVGAIIAIPATRMRDIYLALTTFSFAQAAQWIFHSWTDVTGGTDGLRIPPTSLFGYVIADERAAFPVLAVILGLSVTALMYLRQSSLGRAFAVIRESEHVATVSGINVRRTKIAAFFASAVLAGLAGGMSTLYQSFINAELFGLRELIVVLTMVVVGGMGSLPGVILGVFVIGILPEAMRLVLTNAHVWQEFLYGLILIVFITFAPHGLWATIEKHLRSRA